MTLLGQPIERVGELRIAGALRELAAGSGAGLGETGMLCSVTLPLGRDAEARADPLALFEAALEVGVEASIWLQPSEGLSLVGIGHAWSVQAVGPDRFVSLAAAWNGRLTSSRHRDEAGGVRGTGRILLGGLGFTGRPPSDPTWVPFGAASLVLPGLLVSLTLDGEWLTASIVAGGDGSGPAAIDERPDELERLWTRLLERARASAGRRPRSEGSVALSIVGGRPDRAAWDRLVGRFSGAVGRGRLDKVVLARRVDVAAPVDLDVGGTIRRLAAGAPESTIYAVARGGRVFLGATPERLVRSDGSDFRTVAIAGSTRRGETPEEDAALAAALLASEKEREEHQVVVDALRSVLGPLAETICVGSDPVVVPFRTVQHLVTPITGRLRERAGILSLAGRLHPTPAVGGEPRGLALELIAEHEGFERGWYAAPLGWLGADGDGEFIVALRCGVVSGRTASLFAGCGIVADSEPEREWAESQLKLEVVAAALGELRG